MERFKGERIYANAQMGLREIEAHCAVGPEARRLLETAVNSFSLLTPEPDHNLRRRSGDFLDD